MAHAGIAGASIDNLRIEVFDLDPNDGVAAGFVFGDPLTIGSATLAQGTTTSE